MSPNKMKIPIKADTKAKRDQLVEDTKGNLPKNVNQPPIVSNPAIKADRKPKQSSYEDAGSFGRAQHPISKSNSSWSRT